MLPLIRGWASEVCAKPWKEGGLRHRDSRPAGWLRASQCPWTLLLSSSSLVKKKGPLNQLERLRGCAELRLMNLSGTQWQWENARFLPPPKQLDEGWVTVVQGSSLLQAAGPGAQPTPA